MKPRMLALGLAAVLPAVVALPAIHHALDATSPGMAAALETQAPPPGGAILGGLVVANAGSAGDATPCGPIGTKAAGGGCATATALASASPGPTGGLFAAGGPLVSKTN